MDPVHKMLADVTVRIISRYMIGGLVGAGLMTLATATEVITSPSMQAFLSAAIGGAFAFAVEKATVAARKNGDPT